MTRVCRTCYETRINFWSFQLHI